MSKTIKSQWNFFKKCKNLPKLKKNAYFPSTEPPTGKNDFCPRKFGFFAHPDSAVCDVFYNCNDGEQIEMKCSAGLHFEEYSGTCVWPATANREGCNVDKSKKNLSTQEIWFAN